MRVYLVIIAVSSRYTLRQDIIWREINGESGLPALCGFIRVWSVTSAITRQIDHDVTLVVALPIHVGIRIRIGPGRRNQNVDVFKVRLLARRKKYS